MHITERLKYLDFMELLPNELVCCKCKTSQPKENFGARIIRNQGRFSHVEKQSYCRGCRAEATKKTKAAKKANKAFFNPTPPKRKPIISLPRVAEPQTTPTPLELKTQNITVISDKIKIYDV